MKVVGGGDLTTGGAGGGAGGGEGGADGAVRGHLLYLPRTGSSFQPFNVIRANQKTNNVYSM